jgi:hypothetical protein
MSSIEATLKAVGTTVQFEIVEVIAQVSQAAAVAACAQDEVNSLKQHCTSVASELRVAMGRSQVNPALVEAMHRLYRVGHERLLHAQAGLAAAQERERHVRTRLAALRNSERSLERLLKAERRRRDLDQQARETVEADDIWLQRVQRSLP